MHNNSYPNFMQNEGSFNSTVNNSMTGATTVSSGLRKDHCIPVMIGHINQSGEDLKVWGVSAKSISLSAIVTNIEKFSTKVTFEFKDETGSINGIKWISSDTNYESPVKVKSYAKIFGSIRSDNKSCFILVVHIQPLQELNELITHLMEVTLVSLEGERQTHIVAENDQKLMDSSIHNNEKFNNFNVEEFMISGLNKEQSLVLKIIKSRSAVSEYGAERNEIRSNVPTYMANSIDEILNFLSAEGHIYTTATDDFFKII